MNSFTSSLAAILMVACVGTDLSASVADALIGPDEDIFPVSSGFHGNTAAHGRLLLAAESTTTTTTSTSSDDANGDSSQGNTGYTGASYEGD